MTILETRTLEALTLGYGLAGSLATHLLLFVALAIWMSLEPVRKLIEAAPEPVVSLVFAQDIVPAEPAPRDLNQFVRTSQNTESDTAPANARFISDRNTVASAKLPAEAAGDPTAPTTKGVGVPTLDLANREYKDGELKNDSAASSPPSEARPMTPTEDRPPERRSKEAGEHLPLEVSKPGSMVEAGLMLKAPEEEERPLPKAIPVSTPPAPPPLANAPRPEKDAFQPETRTAEVRGAIGSRGSEDAVNAVMTIEGRYMAEIQKAVGVKWHRYVGPQRDLAKPGIFAVHFFVRTDGRVRPEDITVLSNKDNVVIENVAVKAILDAKIPAIPKELKSSLDKGRFSACIDFLIGL